MSGQQGCRVVGEDIPWRLCVGNVRVWPWCAWAGGLGQCMHIQVSVVYMYNTDMRELRNSGNYVGGECFSRKLMICLESQWCALPSTSRAGKCCRGGVVFEQQSVLFHLSRLWAVVQEVCCHGGK